ncbi:MAG: SDR family NAD(P)-dependent oxidoreductase [Lachnospiraceae bacterium]
MSMNIAIVTGATSGIGREFVRQISMRYTKLDEIWVIGRRKERLEELAQELSMHLTILNMDLRSASDLDHLEQLLRQVKPNVRMLVNSAGFGLVARFAEDGRKISEDMIEVNNKALTSICSMVLPYMKKGSRMINMASAAAFTPQPGFAVYAASKAYVLSFSRALNGELKQRGISVTAVCPGPVKTEFFDVADPNNSIRPFKKFFMVSANSVVSRGLNDARLKRELSIPGIPMRMFFGLAKIIPHKFVIEFMR